MPKINWEQYPAVPGFDCVEMKREIQAEILEVTKDMTDEEVRTFFRNESEVFRKEQAFCNQAAIAK